jgi:CheY-like chemotaxis protein
MPTPHRIALLGFSAFERATLASCLRLSSPRQPSYTLVPTGDESEFVLADAGDAASVRLVLATERQGQTVFVGGQAPVGATAWTPRPIDPAQVLRELDAMVLQASGGSADPSPVATAPSRGNPPPLPPARSTALVVDDSTLAQRFLSSRLLPWGLAVESVGNSGQAMERLSQHSYDFVFLDVELGADSELDGLALCRHIKQQHPLSGALLVMVSAHHGQLDRVRGTLAGCDAYLGKPLRAAELERLLQRQGLQRPQPVASLAAAAG